MLKALIIFILGFAIYKFINGIKIVQQSPSKKIKRDYEDLDIQEAEFEDIDDTEN